MVGALVDVHAESSINVAQVVMVIQLRVRLVKQLSFAVETREQMVTFEKVWDFFFVHCSGVHLDPVTTVKVVMCMSVVRFSPCQSQDQAET